MYTTKDIDDYKDRLTEEQTKRLLSHCNRNDIAPVICAWYDDLDDFYSDWVEKLWLTKTEARELLSTVEFKKFKDGQIVRLVY